MVSKPWRLIRPVMRRTLFGIGLEPLVRKYQLLTADYETRRDRRDTEHLRVLIAGALHPSATCVDIGAHQGGILAELVRCAPEGNHIAIEPIPELAARLRDEFPTVEVHSCAVSDVNGEATFHYFPSRPAVSSLVEHAERTSKAEPITVELRRLDDVVGDAHIDLIKIDVEGVECRVMRGAAATIRRCRPLIVFEHDRRWAEESARETYALVCSFGLRVFDIDGEGPLTSEAFCETVSSGRKWSFVARV